MEFASGDIAFEHCGRVLIRFARPPSAQINGTLSLKVLR